MSISLTGNPFVDTGLAVLAYKSDCASIEELTLEKMKAVHGAGTELARRNSKLKSTSMIFTINSLATHPGIKPAEKRLQLYSAITTAFLNKIGFEDVHERCESCGNEYSLNLNKVISETLVPLGLKNETRYTGRDWFPLAGSIGSDAQALPAGSRTPNLCAKCLFAVHYLPQGVILRDGRLAVFQSTSKEFFYIYVRQIAMEIDDRIRVDNFQTCGSKEGSLAVVRKTLETMSRLKHIDPGTALFVWLFSNSGTGPECSIDEIPNDALQFLFEANREPDFREEIMRLVKKDKNPEYSFMNCIEKGADYYWLYPSKKYLGVSPEFFCLYQTRIRMVAQNALTVACKIAKCVKESFTEAKKFEDYRKDLRKDFAKQNRVRKYIAEMVENGKLTFSDYLSLYAKNPNDPQSTNGDAWKFIFYYLYHIDSVEAIDSQLTDNVAENALLSYVSATIFEGQLSSIGVARFKKEIMARFAIGKITPSWLRRQFVKSAVNRNSFNYEIWKALCLNEQGRERSFEILFRLRLMWSEWLRTNDLPRFTPPQVGTSLKVETDLSADTKKILVVVAQDYVAKRGLARFRKDIIDQLITGEKGLYWFRTQMSAFSNVYSDDVEWEKFCSANGDSIAYLRLFQLNLTMCNYYREQALKAKLAY